MKVTALECPVRTGKGPSVLGLSYDSDKLVVEYDPDTGGAKLRLVFAGPTAFRCLDEGDLLPYWQHPDLVDHWLVRVEEGGWLSMDESPRCFQIARTVNPMEFLVIGVDDCVSVLATEVPIIEVVTETGRANS